MDQSQKFILNIPIYSNITKNLKIKVHSRIVWKVGGHLVNWIAVVESRS